MFWFDPAEGAMVVGCTEHPDHRSMVFTERGRVRWIIEHQRTCHAPMPTPWQVTLCEPD